MEDLAELRRAYDALERPSFAARISSAIGSPVEHVLELLPSRWNQAIHAAAEQAIREALKLAIDSLGPDRPAAEDGWQHSRMAIAAGALGGTFGLPSLLLELPMTTTLLLRAIAATARRHGEDLERLESRLACLEVFAFGGRARTAEYSEIGYYEVRLALAYHFSTAIGAAAEHGSVVALPSTVGLVRGIAARFGVVVSEKTAFQLVPIFGAVAGALVNAAFMAHFERLADGHFAVRRLERIHGKETVRAAYRELKQEDGRVGRVVVHPR